jgi:hypothetical protein
MQLFLLASFQGTSTCPAGAMTWFTSTNAQSVAGGSYPNIPAVAGGTVTFGIAQPSAYSGYQTMSWFASTTP